MKPVLVTRDERGDVSLGFDGFAWHTHADVLAAATGVSKSKEQAVRQFIDDLLNDGMIIVVSRVDGTVKDAWVTDDPGKEMKYVQPQETLEFRYWSGRPWQAA